MLMKKTEILSLPKILFAHTYSTNDYSNSFPIQPGCIEITYIKTGSLTLHVNNEAFVAQAGDVVCALRDAPSIITSEGFHCHHTVKAAVLWESTDASNALNLPYVTKASSETEYIEKIIDGFIYSPYLYDNSYAKAATDFMNILCKINSIYLKENESVHSQSNILTLRAKKFIDKNIYKNITQSEIADFLGITPQYLCSVFKKSEGMPIIKYINITKLKKIHSIMENENLPLYEAAQIFGYSDANYVSHLYKKLFGRNITSNPNIYQEKIDLI